MACCDYLFIPYGCGLTCYAFGFCSLHIIFCLYLLQQSAHFVTIVECENKVVIFALSGGNLSLPLSRIPACLCPVIVILLCSAKIPYWFCPATAYTSACSTVRLCPVALWPVWLSPSHRRHPYVSTRAPLAAGSAAADRSARRGHWPASHGSPPSPVGQGGPTSPSRLLPHTGR